MNRSQFLNTVADRAKAHRRDVEHVWEHALAVIQEAVKRGEDISVTGFGKFKQRVQKARPAGLVRNPFTGEMVHRAARPKTAKPAFTPAKQFREFVAGRGKAPKPSTKPRALAPDGAAPKKAAAKKTARKPARKATKKAARKTARKAPARKKARRR